MNGDKSENILELSDIKAGYKFHTVSSGREIYQEVEVLHGIDLHVRKGEIVTVLGANGAGKTTLMTSVIGLIDRQPINGRRSGKIVFQGTDISKMAPEKSSRLGLTLVPEARYLFTRLTVRDNLDLGSYAVRRKLDKETRKRNLEAVFRLFPRLKERQKQYCFQLSGGEAQMVATARGLLSQPKLLLLDEPCLGLAPLLVDEVMGTLSRLRSEFGITILLAEQNALAALSIADRGYVMKMGEVVAEGSAQELQDSESVRMAYLGR